MRGHLDVQYVSWVMKKYLLSKHGWNYDWFAHDMRPLYKLEISKRTTYLVSLMHTDCIITCIIIVLHLISSRLRNRNIYVGYTRVRNTITSQTTQKWPSNAVYILFVALICKLGFGLSLRWRKKKKKSAPGNVSILKKNRTWGFSPEGIMEFLPTCQFRLDKQCTTWGYFYCSFHRR